MSCCCATESRRAGRSSGNTMPSSREHRRSRARRPPRAIEKTAAHRFDAEHDVLDHAEIRHEIELLIDHADAERFRRLAARRSRPARRRCRSSPPSARIRAGENLHQRRFARAVLADERVHFTATTSKRDAVERADAGKRLHDARHRRAAERR